MDEGEVEKVKPAMVEVMLGGGITIVAGSDTTVTVLTCLFASLITHPEMFNCLRREVNVAFPPGAGDPFDTTKLAELPYLNAVM
jgi:cytochrome P450